MKSPTLTQLLKEILAAAQDNTRSNLRLAFVIGRRMPDVRRSLARAGVRSVDFKGVEGPPSKKQAIEKIHAELDRKGYGRSSSFYYTAAKAAELFGPKAEKILVDAAVPVRDLTYLVSKHAEPARAEILRDLQRGRLKPPYNFSRKIWGDKRPGGVRDEEDDGAIYRPTIEIDVTDPDQRLLGIQSLLSQVEDDTLCGVLNAAAEQLNKALQPSVRRRFWKLI